MLVPSLARMIVREHKFKPITGTLLCLGRQTIAMTYGQALELFEQEGWKVSPEILRNTGVEVDSNTRMGKGTEFISDRLFFQMLGVTDLHVMDVSKYEGADIIHDLNVPVPDSLVDYADFIIDGGTFDHLLNIPTAFANVVKMLKPKGRVFQWNAASNYTGAAYVSFGPDLFYDYYVLNHFADCKIYLAEVDGVVQKESWDMYEFVPTETGVFGHFRSGMIQMVVVLAEKGLASTHDKVPIQAFYRDEERWAPYREGEKLIAQSKRPSLASGKTGLTLKTQPDSRRSRLTKSLREQGLGATFVRILKHPFAIRRPTGSPVGFNHIGRI